MPSDAQKIVESLRELFPGPVVLHEPVFEGKELEYLTECIRSKWVSTAGPFVAEFEQRLASYCGARFAVATASGTAALHIALKLAGVGAQDEVFVPALSFVATANAVTYLGAVPHFVDCEPVTLGLDPAALGEHIERIGEIRDSGCYNRETGRRIGAIVPMHTFGHPVRMEQLSTVAKKYGIPVVEDAAESLGSLYKGKHTGTFSILGALSFNGNKIVTTGGGGAILTDDESLARQAKHLTTTAKKAHPWRFDHDEVGYNYRLPNINAGLGLAQLERLPQFIERKRALYGVYRDLFSGLTSVRVQAEPPEARSNYWLHALVLDEHLKSELDGILAELDRHSVQLRPVWTPLHTLPMYLSAPRAPLPCCEDLAQRILCLPSGAGIQAQIARP